MPTEEYMPTDLLALSRRWLLAGAALVLLAPAGSAQPAPALPAVAAPIPPGQARVWIYRDYEPYVTTARPYVRMNDAIVGVSEPGGAFYRDVPPGTYRVTVDSYGRDVNQFAQAVLAPGQTIYLKIESLRDWVSGSDGFRRDTFYTRPMPTDLARTEIARNRSWRGGPG
jgi:hypothetical protein